MKLRLTLLILACATCGALAFHYWKTSTHLRQKLLDSNQSPSAARAVPLRTFTDSFSNMPPGSAPEEAAALPASDPAELLAMSNQIVVLQSSLAEKDQLIESLRWELTNQPPRQDRPWRDQTNWMEQIKKDDPKRYEEIVKAREENRQKINRSFAEKADYLLKRDKSKMGDDEKVQYEQMVSLLNDLWLLAEKMRTDNLPRDQRWETMQAMRSNISTLEPMMKNERDRVLYDSGKKMGYSDSEAQNFVQYMNDLIDVTSLQDIYRGMRGGGRGMDGPPRGAPPPR